MPETPGNEHGRNGLSPEDLFDQVYGNLQRQRSSSAAQERLMRRITESMPSGIRFPAEDMRVEFVTDASRGADFDARHNSLLRTQEVVDALISNQQDKMAAVMLAIKNEGGFFEPYHGVGAERLQDHLDWRNPAKGGWLMAETSGHPVTQETQYRRGERIIGGDGHFQIAPDRQMTLDEYDVPLPIGHEDIVLEGKEIIHEILADPACAMLIADICSLPATHRMGFAAVTEDVAIAEAAKLNDNREHRLKYAVAAIYSIKGLVDAQGRELSDRQEVGWLNIPSIVIHTRRSALAGHILGKQVNRFVDVELPGGDMGALRVDKYITSQPLAAPVRPNVEVIGGRD